MRSEDGRGAAVKIEEVGVSVPEGHQLIFGQSHFIKSVEDIYEALATSMPGIKFGVAFCEASGKSLIRSDGSDPGCVSLAVDCAARVAAGHAFVVFLSGSFPINVLNRIKQVEEVAQVYCATANEVTVVVADSGKGRGVLGVIDGGYPKGEEGEEDKAERRDFLRKLGYKR
ncbi:MAG: adenosine-specific kinase [Nitrososphaerota archaeon]|nr:adenosine-specific kinase [Nitrososphaerota archaeon]MDG7015215.1 adenosine-specific kinase [Nitrososphaerota archaeon]WGO49973.1 MAG: adenosine-specific kinase [Nitrososphaerota archaeon]